MCFMYPVFFFFSQIILALGNYMNSSKRGCVYGFKLQSLDLVRTLLAFRLPTVCLMFVDLKITKPLSAEKLLDTKSTDRKMTLLHYIALIVKEKYPELANFYNELHFVDKAAAGEARTIFNDWFPPQNPLSLINLAFFLLKYQLNNCCSMKGLAIKSISNFKSVSGKCPAGCSRVGQRHGPDPERVQLA